MYEKVRVHGFCEWAHCTWPLYISSIQSIIHKRYVEITSDLSHQIVPLKVDENPKSIVSSLLSRLSIK